METIYYEIALYLNEELYKEVSIPYDIYKKAKKILLKEIEINKYKLI